MLQQSLWVRRGNASRKGRPDRSRPPVAIAGCQAKQRWPTCWSQQRRSELVKNFWSSRLMQSIQYSTVHPRPCVSCFLTPLRNTEVLCSMIRASACTGAYTPPGPAPGHPVQTFLGGAHAMTSQRKPAFLRGGPSSYGTLVTIASTSHVRNVIRHSCTDCICHCQQFGSSMVLCSEPSMGFLKALLKPEY